MLFYQRMHTTYLQVDYVSHFANAFALYSFLCVSCIIFYDIAHSPSAIVQKFGGTSLGYSRKPHKIVAYSKALIAKTTFSRCRFCDRQVVLYAYADKLCFSAGVYFAS